MMRRAMLTLMAWVVIVALVGSVAPVQAQDAPAAVLAALDALSAQVGTTLTLQNLASWQWAQENFPDTSLGCPQEGFTYPDTMTNGFVVTFVYNGVFYDYRVTANLQTVFQCTPTSGAPGGTPINGALPTPTPQGTPLVPAPIPTITPQPIVAAPVTGTVVCPGGLPTRLATGIQARSVATGSINIRNPADLNDPNAVVGLLLPGSTFNVIGGPQCANGRTWWQITYHSAGGTITGWAIEGDNIEYWLEPLGEVTVPAPVPTVAGTPITPFNAAQLSVLNSGTALSTTQTVLLPAPAPDALLVDAAGIVHVIDGATIVELGGFVNHGLRVQHIATGPKTDTIARVATIEVDPNAASGSVLYVYELTKTGPLMISITERYGFQLPHVPNDLVFSPDGRLLAASAGDILDAGAGPVPPNLVWLWDAETGQQLSTLQLTGSAADMAFSPDGQYLAITEPWTGVHLWSLNTMQELALLPSVANWQGKPSLAFHPNGSLLAVGTEDGQVILYDLTNPAAPQTRSVLQAFAVGSGAAVDFVTFNSTGTLLATGGMFVGDVTRNAGVILWDPTTGGRLATYATPLMNPLTGLAFRDNDQSLIMVGGTGWWTWGVQ